MLDNMEWRDRQVNIHPRELEPLEAGHASCDPPRLPALRMNSRTKPTACCRTPIKVARLLVLLILLPTIFIIGPLYMRYRVFSSQMYPMSMTDMRLIDGKVSPTWCQRQVVKSNSTFNAFVMPSAPELSSQLVNVSMTRQMTLKADMKEYWGFYLLHGSSVTVSACVQHPGASLIMIKGYKHLQDCAYIGDDSSEEADELLRAKEAGLLTQETLEKRLAALQRADGKANQPDNMKRHTAGVKFHDPYLAESDTVTSSDHAPYSDETDEDPKELRAILEHLNAARQAVSFKLPQHLVAVPEMHRHRDTNVDRDERQFLTFNDLLRLRQNYTPEVEAPKQIETIATTSKPNISKVEDNMNEKRSSSLQVISNNTEDTVELQKENVINETERKTELGSRTRILEEHKKPAVEVNLKVPEFTTATIRSKAKQSIDSKDTDVKAKEITNNGTESNDNIQTNEDKAQVELIRKEKEELTLQEDEGQDSKEIFEDVLKRLQALGERGRRVLRKLHKSMGVDEVDETSNSLEAELMNQVTGSSEELDRLRRVLVQAIDEERTRPRTDATEQQSRSKRQIVLGARAEFERSLNEDDESRDYAAEEVESTNVYRALSLGLTPDGHAVDHEIVNDTSPYDMSRSEFWSSFSSSEEALLECEGLILNLPLTLHPRCEDGASETTRLDAAMRNALTYRVPANGYYFFVFNSENEVQPNFISVRFELQKTRYEVARSALRECRNSTDRCDLLLDIFSTQKVVLELPLRNNDSLWNEQFVVMSECEPRTSIYLACAIAVPLLIMIFAFQ